MTDAQLLAQRHILIPASSSSQFYQTPVSCRSANWKAKLDLSSGDVPNYERLLLTLLQLKVKKQRRHCLLLPQGGIGSVDHKRAGDILEMSLKRLNINKKEFRYWVLLNGAAFAQQVWGSGFNPLYQKRGRGATRWTISCSQLWALRRFPVSGKTERNPKQD